MADLLKVADLEVAKKHDTFHSEVITGKTGGLSGGTDINYATNAVTGQVQKTLPKTVDDLDWTPVGTFAAGVTFTKSTDYALDASGNQWIYAGASPFPVIVSPGTVPSSPDYKIIYSSDYGELPDGRVIQHRRGTSTEIAAYTLADGEIIKNDDDGTLHVGDGVTPGGVKLSKYLTFKSIAEMKSGLTSLGSNVKLIEGERVRWTGYYEQSDGGSNWGIVKTGAHTEDGGSIFSIDANTYVEANLKGKYINVKKFGAHINGVDDDFEQISSAIRYAEEQIDSSKNYSGCVLKIGGAAGLSSGLVITKRNIAVVGNSCSSSGFVSLSGFSGTHLLSFIAPGVPSDSYIDRFLDGANVKELFFYGNQLEDHPVSGLYLAGVYNSNYSKLKFLNVDKCAELNGTIKCTFEKWFDGERRPAGTNKPNYIIVSSVVDNTQERDNTIRNIVMHAKVMHFDFSNGTDGINITDNILFVNNTDLQAHIRIRNGLYGNISRNKLFESRHSSVLLDGCANMTVDNNVIAIAGQSEQVPALKITNSDKLAGYGRNITVTGNTINRCSGDSISIEGIDGFSITGNRSDLAGYDGFFAGTWGAASHIRVRNGCKNGNVSSNPCNNADFNNLSEYSRSTYEVLLESGTSFITVDGQTPYYCHSNGLNNTIINSDISTNDSGVIRGESARNLLRGHTRDLTGWGVGNTGTSSPTVSYYSGALGPTDRVTGVSVVTFPVTTSGDSWVSSNVGGFGPIYMPVPVADDRFLASVWMKSNSGSMRKVTLTIKNSSNTFSASKVFNVGTEWKRYWFEAAYDGTASTLYQFLIRSQQTSLASTISVFGAKVELIKSTEVRHIPSAYDFNFIRYKTSPTSTNGGDCQVGDRFLSATPTVGSVYEKICTTEGANSLVLTDLPVL